MAFVDTGVVIWCYIIWPFSNELHGNFFFSPAVSHCHVCVCEPVAMVLPERGRETKKCLMAHVHTRKPSAV